MPRAAPRAERLRVALVEQVSRLLRDKQVSLGVPLESRVKPLESLSEKIERKTLALDRLVQLTDLVGIRIILLFKRDLEVVQELISNAFRLLSSEDVAGRLDETHFGYQSLHVVVQLPEQWLAVPTLADLGDIKAEFQVRTLAQHIWAAASHELQYKREASVPPPIRRSIHRVSALLETVDLEFDRVLSERVSYVAGASPSTSDEILNVDLLAAVLNENFPPENLQIPEAYAQLLDELGAFGVKTAADLRRLISKHKAGVAESEAYELQSRAGERDPEGTTKERMAAGVFFTHVGLAREVLRQEFGTRYEIYLRDLLIRRLYVQEDRPQAMRPASKRKSSSKKITNR